MCVCGGGELGDLYCLAYISVGTPEFENQAKVQVECLI